jgi:hypothetical protein
MGERRGAYTSSVLVSVPEEKRQVGKPGRRWDVNFKMDR